MLLGFRLLALTLLLALPARSQEQPAPPNLLLVVIDDVGVDKIGAYGEHTDPGRTPNIDALASRGLLFRNVWANPVCSPTRATILTGRFGFRTGVGAIVTRGGVGAGLSASEHTFAKALADTYAVALLGKWHLGLPKDGLSHPLDCGFEEYAGMLGNIPDYQAWTKVVAGEERPTTVYATTDTTEDALRFIERTGEPWCLVVSHQAAHRPFHEPPPHLHTFDDLPPPEEEPEYSWKVKAATEALDHELGRLFAALDLERTYVLLVGDNGTYGQAMTAPFNPKQGKGSLAQGGVRVPLIITGPDVRRGECDALVNTTDLHATLLGLAGVASTAEDSLDLGPLLRDPDAEHPRRYQYAERFYPNGPGPYDSVTRAISDGRFKLVQHDGGARQELYRLRKLHVDGNDLLLRDEGLPKPAKAALVELETELDRLLSTRQDGE